MKQLSCFVVVVLLLNASSCSNGSQAQASIKTGFSPSVRWTATTGMWEPRRCLTRGEKVGEAQPTIPIPAGMKITHFQGTASCYTNGGCAGPVLASLVDRDSADYSHPPLMYPIILNSSGPGVQLWFDYSTPLVVMHDGLRIEAYGIPKGNSCTGDFEIQGVITVE